MNGQRTHQFNLYGNLGGDPEPHTLKARTVTRQGYDINLDVIADQEHTIPERQIYTVSLAINGRCWRLRESAAFWRLPRLAATPTSPGCHRPAS